MESVISTTFLTEEDLQKLFQLKKSSETAKYIILFMVIFSLLFVGFNYQAIRDIVTFKKPHRVLIPNSNKPLPKVEVKDKNNNPVSPKKTNPKDEIKLENNHLFLPSTNINTPIIFDTPLDNASELKNLQSGVIHLKGTAKPGIVGNVVITGHSSYYSWDPGKYKSIFVNLKAMKLSDKAYIRYNNQLYIYQVKEVYEVQPNQVEVMKQAGKTELTLITCTPTGTALRRLVIKLEQISPIPDKNIKFTGESINNKLSAIPGAQ